MSRAIAVSSILLFSVAIFTPVHLASQAAGQGRGLGKPAADGRGRKSVRPEMPPEMGAKNGRELVDALRGVDLSEKVRNRGGDPEQLALVAAIDEALWVDSNGQAMFMDVAEHGDTAADGTTSTDTAGPTAPPPTPSAVLPSGLPIHHSKPGAPWTLFIDFDGATVRGNIQGWTHFGVRFTQGFGLDATFGSFSPDEQAVISRTWARVAEDWLPFDIDVTTEYPPALDSPSVAERRTVLWSVVGRNPADFSFASNIAGVALFSLNYIEFGPERPNFVFAMDSPDHSFLADVITQESGHMFGLLHDNFFNPLCGGGVCEYYPGHGTGPTSWGPVMGGPIGKNVTQWSRGDYANGTNDTSVYGVFGLAPQDDIAIIAGKLGFRGDDYGDTIAVAAPLALPTLGHITSTTDADVFALPRASDVRIEITPFRAGELTDGGNLDAAADILDTAGVVVASIDDVHETSATLVAVLPPGQHYLRVRPTFSDNYPIYGSLGQYTVTGTFTNVVRLTEWAEPLPSETMTAGRTVPVKFGLTDPVAIGRVQLWSESAAAAAEVLAETTCRPQPPFREHCNLRLPRTLTSGQTYWIAAQYQDLDGHWITAQPSPGTTSSNPSPFTAR